MDIYFEHLSKQAYNVTEKNHIKARIEALVGKKDAQEIFDEVDAEHNTYTVDVEICRLLDIERLVVNGIPVKDIKTLVSYKVEEAALSALTPAY